MNNLELGESFTLPTGERGWVINEESQEALICDPEEGFSLSTRFLTLEERQLCVPCGRSDSLKDSMEWMKNPLF